MLYLVSARNSGTAHDYLSRKALSDFSIRHKYASISMPFELLRFALLLRFCTSSSLRSFVLTYSHDFLPSCLSSSGFLRRLSSASNYPLRSLCFLFLITHAFPFAGLLLRILRRLFPRLYFEVLFLFKLFLLRCVCVLCPTSMHSLSINCRNSSLMPILIYLGLAKGKCWFQAVAHGNNFRFCFDSIGALKTAQTLGLCSRTDILRVTYSVSYRFIVWASYTCSIHPRATIKVARVSLADSIC